MNDKFGTTKLLPVSRNSPAARSIIDDAIAVRFGARTSGITLVDGTDPGKLLIFQITYADEAHRGACIEFLASGDDKSKVRRVFVDRVVPEFTERLPEFADSTNLINYAQMVPKSARLLFDLSDSFENILYQDAGVTPSPHQFGQSCALVHSTNAATSITVVDRRLPEHPATTRRACDAIHSALRETRLQLAALLSLDAETETETVDCQLAFLLHSLSLTEKPEAFQSAFASLAQSAVESHAALIRDALDRDSQDWGAVVVCDAIFCSQFCRLALVSEFEESNPASLAVSFVADSGLLGSIGCLSSS